MKTKQQEIQVIKETIEEIMPFIGDLVDRAYLSDDARLKKKYKIMSNISSSLSTLVDRVLEEVRIHKVGTMNKEDFVKLVKEKGITSETLDQLIYVGINQAVSELNQKIKKLKGD